MRNTVMLWGVVLLFTSVASDMLLQPGPGQDLDQAEGLPINNADFLPKMPKEEVDSIPERISNEEIDFDMNSTVEPAKGNLCEDAGGICTSKKGAKKECKGLLIAKKLKCGTKKDVCCISDTRETCEDAGDKCIPKKKAKTCTGEIVKTLKCTNKKDVCCKSSNTTIDVIDECPGNFKNIGGTCYYFSSDQDDPKLSWPDANQQCVILGRSIGKNVHLAELGQAGNCPSDALLMQAITERGVRYVWLGAEKEKNEGVWKWIYTGRPLSVENSYWAPNEPNNVPPWGVVYEDDCLLTMFFGRFNRAYFNDGHCTSVFHFICQIFPN